MAGMRHPFFCKACQCHRQILMRAIALRAHGLHNKKDLFKSCPVPGLGLGQKGFEKVLFFFAVLCKDTGVQP